MTLSDLAWFVIAALTTGNGFLWVAWRRAEASRLRWTTPNQPPTPPAVTDEMVEAAVTEFAKCVAAFTAAVHPHDHEITKRAMDDRRAALRALIARARTPETATPVPGRLSEAVKNVLAIVTPPLHGFPVWSEDRDVVLRELRDSWKAALASAPTPAAEDDDPPCENCGDPRSEHPGEQCYPKPPKLKPAKPEAEEDGS